MLNKREAHYALRGEVKRDYSVFQIEECAVVNEGVVQGAVQVNDASPLPVDNTLTNLKLRQFCFSRLACADEVDVAGQVCFHSSAF